MKILIVEDDLDSRLVLQKNLEGAGHAVVAAATGQEALEKARKSPPDLIISDILMPVMDGFKLCYEVKNDRRLNRIPFVFYTATYVDIEDERLAIGLGASRFILKPVDPDRFLEMIDEIVRQTEEDEIAVPEEIVEDPLNIFRRYDASISNKLQKKVRELEVYRKIFAHATDAIAIVKKDGTIVQRNNAHRKLVGHDDDEIRAVPLGRFIDEAAAARIGEGLAMASPVMGEGTVTSKSGDRSFVEYTLFPIKDESAETMDHVWILRDISERKKAEETLRREKDKLEAITRGVGAGLVIISRDYKVLWANREIENMFGNVLGQLCHEIFNQRGEICPSCGVREIFDEGKEEVIHEQTGKSIKGEKVWSEIIATPMKDAEGNVVAALEVVIDITARKRSEERAERARQEWEKTFEAVGDIVMLLDSDLRITRANRAAHDAFRLQENELIGRRCYEVFRGIDEPCPGCPVPGRLEEAKGFRGEVEHPDLGRIFWVSTAPICNEQNKVIGVAHFARDITEQKNLEADFRHSQKMEAIGTLAGGVAHDFNNVLTVIQGYVNLTLAMMDGDDPFYDNLKHIESAGRRAADIVRQLLLFSRKRPMKKKELDLCSLARDLLGMVGRFLGEQVSIKMDFGTNIWSVSGDAGSIDQAIMNLVVNARDAMPEGGTLEIAIENRVIDEQYCRLNPDASPGKYVELTVRDTGKGMNDDILDHIFDPFFSTKDVHKGTGLGLSVVYGIVHEHGGWITVSSSPGAGTAFTMYFPASEKGRADSSAHAGPEPTDRSLRGGGQTILVVEDDKVIREMYGRTLAQYGYKVIEAGNAQEALDFFASHKGKIDLLFSDIVLPDRSGLELRNRLTADFPGIRVLLCSGYPTDVSAWREIHEKDIPFLEKPFHMDALLQKIRELLG